MSDHFGTTWIKKTRKRHRCGWCSKIIDAGSTASYAAGIFDGDFWADHYHPECQEAIDTIPYRELEEGWEPGMYSRGRMDEENLPPVFSPDYRGGAERKRRIPELMPESNFLATVSQP